MTLKARYKKLFLFVALLCGLVFYDTKVSAEELSQREFLSWAKHKVTETLTFQSEYLPNPNAPEIISNHSSIINFAKENGLNSIASISCTPVYLEKNKAEIYVAAKLSNDQRRTKKYAKITVAVEENERAEGFVITSWEEAQLNGAPNCEEIVSELKGTKPSDTDPSTISIPIEPMSDLNYKTKDEILERRKTYVDAHKTLLTQPYEPSGVFSLIEDNTPWWGILGLSYYGKGENSIQGLSEESRFINNPFLLIGLVKSWAAKVKNSQAEPMAVYPKPTKLEWYKDKPMAVVTYDIKSFAEDSQKLYGVKSGQLSLIGYNARDLGWRYLQIFPEKSENIKHVKPKGAVKINHYLHKGNSCGHQDGCNNASPHQPELDIEVQNLPAKVYIKLWKENPLRLSVEPDMVFIVEMI